MTCDKDCLHCGFEDCINDEFTPEELRQAEELIQDHTLSRKEQRRKDYRAEWLAKNRERVNAQNRAYYADHREQCKASARAYYAAHREDIAAKRKAYEAANRERIAARKKAWRQANREKINEYKRAYKARKRAEHGNIPGESGPPAARVAGGERGLQNRCPAPGGHFVGLLLFGAEIRENRR